LINSEIVSGLDPLDQRYYKLMTVFLTEMWAVGVANQRTTHFDQSETVEEIMGGLGDFSGLNEDQLARLRNFVTSARDAHVRSEEFSHSNTFELQPNVALFDLVDETFENLPSEIRSILEDASRANESFLSSGDPLALHPFGFLVAVHTQTSAVVTLREGLLAVAMGALESGLTTLKGIVDGAPSPVPTSRSFMDDLLKSSKEILSNVLGDSEALADEVADINNLRHAVIHRESRFDSRLISQFKGSLDLGEHGGVSLLSASFLDNKLQKIFGFGVRVILASWISQTTNASGPTLGALTARALFEHTRASVALEILSDLRFAPLETSTEMVHELNDRFS